MSSTIGEIARLAGVGVETIRYYERQGLIERPPRPASGFRRYDSGVIRRVRFIRRAQQLGFTLQEVRELLALRVDPATSCSEVKEKAVEKIAEVERKLAGLRQMREALVAITESCAGVGPTSDCPILDALDDAGAIGADERRKRNAVS